MNWLISFCNDFLEGVNQLVALMTSPIGGGLGELLGTPDHPITFMNLISFLLIDYILAMFLLRIIRG